MLDLGMATDAFDRMARDVDLVHKPSVCESAELFRLVVTGQTAPAAGFAPPFGDIQVALLAIHRSPDNVLVIEAHRADHDVPFRGTVAPGAARNRRQLRSVLGFLEMAEEAGPPVHLEMAIDDDLGRAAGDGK